MSREIVELFVKRLYQKYTDTEFCETIIEEAERLYENIQTKIRYNVDPKAVLREKDKVDKINELFCSIAPNENACDISKVFKEIFGSNDKKFLPSLIVWDEKKLPKEYLNVIREIANSKNKEKCIDIQFMFWLLYWGKSKNVDYYDFLKICICCLYLEISEEELDDLINIICRLHNSILGEYACTSERTAFFNDGIFFAQTVEHEDKKMQLELDVYFKADNIPLVYVNTYEEQKVMKELVSCAYSHGVDKVYCYEMKNGLSNVDKSWIMESIEGYSMNDVMDMISDEMCHDETYNAIFIMRTVEMELREPAILSKLKILAEEIISRGNKIQLYFIGKDLQLPPIIEKYFVINDEYGYPTKEQLAITITEFAKEKNIEIEKKDIDEISYNCKGLTSLEIMKILNLIFAKYWENGEFEIEKMKEVIQHEKKLYLKNAGLLEIIDPENFDNLIGLDVLKEWLKKKSVIYKNIADAKQHNVSMPKGILLAGMPGCGKSMCAKATADIFGLPLLRMDIGNILDKYVGSSERNIKEALKLAEAISPCVLWMDEFEKSFPKKKDESGTEVSSRLLGSLLVWLQEHTSDVFVVATVNDIKELPPEIMRAGRFDERFFVDLPNDKEKKMLFEHYIKEKQICFEDYEKIVKGKKKLSGAEIKKVVEDVMEQRYINIINKDNAQVTVQMFEDAIKNMNPLAEMKQWTENEKEIKELKDSMRAASASNSK